MVVARICWGTAPSLVGWWNSFLVRDALNDSTKAGAVCSLRPVFHVDPAASVGIRNTRYVPEGLRLFLTLLKAVVRAAYDGAEALRIWEDWEPTHVLMDLGMPGMDGFEAARRLRANHPDRVFRLIAISGWGREEDQQQTRQAGFDQHLVKPVGIAALRR